MCLGHLAVPAGDRVEPGCECDWFFAGLDVGGVAVVVEVWGVGVGVLGAGGWSWASGLDAHWSPPPSLFRRFQLAANGQIDRDVAVPVWATSSRVKRRTGAACGPSLVG